MCISRIALQAPCCRQRGRLLSAERGRAEAASQESVFMTSWEAETACAVSSAPAGCPVGKRAQFPTLRCGPVRSDWHCSFLGRAFCLQTSDPVTHLCPRSKEADSVRSRCRGERVLLRDTGSLSCGPPRFLQGHNSMWKGGLLPLGSHPFWSYNRYSAADSR
jgi:hypothetical protein